MNGAEAILGSLIGNGVEVCFANPGTSEMHFVSALDRTPAMRCVLCLSETVVTGAADGYARISGKPAVTLLHTGPGLANGLSNLHNARRAPVPIVNIVGDHALSHVKLDAPLASDTLSLAKSMSHWVKRIEEPGETQLATVAAIVVTQQGAGRIATLILPADIAWSEVSVDGDLRTGSAEVRQVDPAVMASAVAALRSAEGTMILLGGSLSVDRLEKAAAIAAKHGVRLARELSPVLLVHGAGVPTIEHMPYPPELMHAFMAGTRELILVGAKPPTTFFAYPGVRGSAVPEGCRLHILAQHGEAIDSVLNELLLKTGADGNTFKKNEKGPPALRRDETLDAETIANILAANLPEHAIVIDEAISSGFPIIEALQGANVHEIAFLTGGSIGWGIPAAVGAAIAAPHRKVICLEGDGSALYSVQGLWTLAREKLDVVVIIYANRSYSILKTEFERVGARPMGERARAVLSIGAPTIDFVALAQSLGVRAIRADLTTDFATALAMAIAERGPMLIEAVVADTPGVTRVADSHSGQAFRNLCAS